MQVSIRLSRRRMAAIAFLVAGLLAVPAYVLASHQFTDVPTSNTFHDDIDAIADAGVTTGCAAGKYCPKDFVTREQMAAFLNRLGALEAGKTPVVNADRLDGYSSGDLSRVVFARAPTLIDGNAAPTTGTLVAPISVPGPGYLIVSGNTTLYNPAAGATDANCVLRFQGGVNLQASYHQTSVGSPGGTHIWTSQCTSQSVTEVCLPTTYTLEFYVQAGNAEAHAQNATLILQYVPFGDGGLPPTCTSS